MKRALALAARAARRRRPRRGRARDARVDRARARHAAADTAPEQVELRFSEPVELALGAVRVHDADGAEVQQGDAFHPGGTAAAVAVRLSDGLADGGYTVTYRVVSADSHPVSGGFVFAVGEDAAPPARGVAELLGDQKAGPVTSVAFTAARGVQYGAIALGLGLLAVLLLAWRPALRATGAGDARRPPRSPRGRGRCCSSAAVAGAASGVVAIGLQAATAQGTPLWSALGAAGDVLRHALRHRLGRPACSPGSLAGALAARRAARSPQPSRWPGSRCCPASAATRASRTRSPCCSPPTCSTCSARAPGSAGSPRSSLALPAATRAVGAEARTPLLAATMARFSTIALAGVAALLAGGILQSVLQLDAVADLVETAFGRAILVKAGLVLALLVLGALNRRRILPALDRAAADGASPGRAGALLRRSLRAEVALGIAAFAATGALAGYPPGTTEASGPYSASAALGPARVDLTVEPAQAGPNELHLYLFDAQDGTQYDVPSEVAVSPPRCPSAVSSRSRSTCARPGRGTTWPGAPRSRPRATGGSSWSRGSPSSTSCGRRSRCRSAERQYGGSTRRPSRRAPQTLGRPCRPPLERPSSALRQCIPGSGAGSPPAGVVLVDEGQHPVGHRPREREQRPRSPAPRARP